MKYSKCNHESCCKCTEMCELHMKSAELNIFPKLVIINFKKPAIVQIQNVLLSV